MSHLMRLSFRFLGRGGLALVISSLLFIHFESAPGRVGTLVRGLASVAYAKSAKRTSARKSAKDRAKTDFKRGKIAFGAKRYVEALVAFESAYQSYPLPLMLFNIASVYEQLNLLPQALKKYEAFVKTGKDQRGEAAAKITMLREKLDSWVEVRISSQPAGCEVRLNDPRLPSLGKTPLTLKLEPQRHLKLFLKPQRGESFEEEVLLTPAPKRQTINVKIPKREAWVRVIGSPKKARVKSGEVSVSRLPALLKLTVGEHEIEVLSADYLPVKKLVQLKAVHTQRDPLTVQVDLKSSAGVALVSINIKTPNALLLIDGTPSGRSPFSEPFEVSEGEHLIEVKGPKGESFSERITLKSGETSNIEVDFEQSSSFLQEDRLSIGLMSLGGVSLLTGAILGGVALSNSSGLEECRAHQLCARRQGELDRAQTVRTYATSADVLIGLGVVVGAAGGVLYWLDHRDASPEVKPSAQVTVIPLPGGAGLHGAVTF